MNQARGRPNISTFRKKNLNGLCLLKSKLVRFIRDIFVFSCFIGLTYADMRMLSNKHLLKMLDGKERRLVIQNSKQQCRMQLYARNRKAVQYQSFAFYIAHHTFAFYQQTITAQKRKKLVPAKMRCYCLNIGLKKPIQLPVAQTVL